MIGFCKIFYVSFIELLIPVYFLYRYFMGSDPERLPEDIGCSCQWHILCVWQGPVNSVLSKKATTELEALSRQKSIRISSDVQKKVIILMHL